MAAVAPVGPIGPVGPRRAGLEAEAVLGKAYDIRLMRRLAHYVRPHVVLLVGWVTFTLIRTAFELAQPALVAYVLQHHILGGDLAALPFDALGYVGLAMTYGGLWLGWRFYARRVASTAKAASAAPTSRSGLPSKA